jgi:hypothetical protein
MGNFAAVDGMLLDEGGRHGTNGHRKKAIHECIDVKRRRADLQEGHG